MRQRDLLHTGFEAMLPIGTISGTACLAVVVLLFPSNGHLWSQRGLSVWLGLSGMAGMLVMSLVHRMFSARGLPGLPRDPVREARKQGLVMLAYLLAGIVLAGAGVVWISMTEDLRAWPDPTSALALPTAASILAAIATMVMASPIAVRLVMGDEPNAWARDLPHLPSLGPIPTTWMVTVGLVGPVVGVEAALRIVGPIFCAVAVATVSLALFIWGGPANLRATRSARLGTAAHPQLVSQPARSPQHAALEATPQHILRTFQLVLPAALIVGGYTFLLGDMKPLPMVPWLWVCSAGMIPLHQRTLPVAPRTLARIALLHCFGVLGASLVFGHIAFGAVYPLMAVLSLAALLVVHGLVMVPASVRLYADTRIIRLLFVPLLAGSAALFFELFRVAPLPGATAHWHPASLALHQASVDSLPMWQVYTGPVLFVCFSAGMALHARRRATLGIA